MIELLTHRLLEHARIAVIFGGSKSAEGAVINSAGNPRSWKSYEAVANDIGATLSRLGCRHVDVIPDDMRLISRLQESRTQLAWLNTGGVQGQNAIAHASAMLELAGIPYVGHSPLVAAALDNKHFFKRQMVAMGLPTAPFIVWNGHGRQPDPMHCPRFAHVFRDWAGGYVVKPVTGRASLNVHYVERAEDVGQVARDVHAVTQNPVLIEAYLSGREYCIAVNGPLIARSGALERLSGPFSFAAVERILENDERVFTSMDTKPITLERMRPLDPRRDAVDLDTLEDMATRLYEEFPLTTLVRLDVRADAKGRLYVLEANPKPDLKAAAGSTISLIEAGLERYGMSYDDLILSIFANRAAALLDDEASISDSLKRFTDR